MVDSTVERFEQTLRFWSLPPLNDDERRAFCIEPAWARLDYFYRNDDGLLFNRNHAAGAGGIEQLVHKLNLYRADYERGEGIALLYAIKACADVNLPLVDWAAHALEAVLVKRLSVDGPHSLDVLLHDPQHPASGKRARATRRYWSRLPELYVSVSEAIHRDRLSFDASIKRSLKAMRWSISVTKARALLEAQNARQRRLVGGRLTFSQMAARFRKAATRR